MIILLGQITSFYDVEEITSYVLAHFQESSEECGLDYDNVLTCHSVLHIKENSMDNSCSYSLQNHFSLNFFSVNDLISTTNGGGKNLRKIT